ncbi:UNVERIFIED_CONTAM: hypothetical protein FKN15_010192 [Acipenser sinensis]
MIGSTQIRGSEKPIGRELHIAYRHGEHYDSVRRIGDNSESPAHLRTETLSRGGESQVDRNRYRPASPAGGDPGGEVSEWGGCTVSSKQRKEQQRLEKKSRQEEKHRQRARENQNQNQDQDQDPDSGVHLVRTFSTLNI